MAGPDVWHPGPASYRTIRRTGFILADWFYIGNYGQLGPLKDDQMKELIEVGVIESGTHVWREDYTDWVFAKDAPELLPFFGNAPRSTAVPPPPPSHPSRFNVEGPGSLSGPQPDPGGAKPVIATPPRVPARYQSLVTEHTYIIPSDKSRTVGGLLNLIPGVGRFYLGYSAIGFLQLFTTVFCGIGLIWSWVDGVGILSGFCPDDGYGRKLQK